MYWSERDSKLRFILNFIWLYIHHLEARNITRSKLVWGHSDWRLVFSNQILFTSLDGEKFNREKARIFQGVRISNEWHINWVSISRRWGVLFTAINYYSISLIIWHSWVGLSIFESTEASHPTESWFQVKSRRRSCDLYSAFMGGKLNTIVDCVST